MFKRFKKCVLLSFDQQTFNRPNLRYEVRIKYTRNQIEKMNKKKKEGEPPLLYYIDEILQYLKSKPDQVGIIYVLSRNEAGSALFNNFIRRKHVRSLVKRRDQMCLLSCRNDIRPSSVILTNPF